MAVASVQSCVASEERDCCPAVAVHPPCCAPGRCDRNTPEALAIQAAALAYAAQLRNTTAPAAPTAPTNGANAEARSTGGGMASASASASSG